MVYTQYVHRQLQSSDKTGGTVKVNTSEVVRLYLKHPGNGMTRPSTIKTRREFLRRLDDRDIAKWKEDDLVDLLVSLKIADSTKATYRNHLVSFFEWAHWQKHIKQNPAAHLKRALSLNPRAVRKHNWLTAEEVATVLASTPDTLIGRRDNLILRIGFTTALRAKEIISIRWSHVDLNDRSLWIPDGKGGKAAELAISRNTHAVLADWYGMAAAALGRPPADEPVVIAFHSSVLGDHTARCRPLWTKEILYDSLLRRIALVSERSGVRFRPHDMRRTYAGLLEESGSHIDSIQRALRHSSSATTERYLSQRLDKARIAQESAGLDF